MTRVAVCLLRLRFLIPTWAVGQAWPRTVLLRRDLPEAWHREVVAHELCHVHQWERLGYLGFALEYLRQVRQYGYHSSPLEGEARAAAYSGFYLNWASDLLAARKEP
jgi:hypothetical protein